MEPTVNRREELLLRNALHPVLKERQLDLAFHSIGGRTYEGRISPRGNQFQDLIFTAHVERMLHLGDLHPLFREAERRGRGDSLVGTSVRFTPIRSESIDGTDWVGLVADADVSLTCEDGMDEDFVSRISDYLRTTSLEKKSTSSLSDKAVPRDVYAVWKGLSNVAREGGQLIEVLDSGWPLPGLKITDRLGQVFVFDTRSPLTISLNGDVVETVSHDTNLDGLFYRFKQFYLDHPDTARENMLLGKSQREAVWWGGARSEVPTSTQAKAKLDSASVRHSQDSELFKSTTAFFEIKSGLKDLIDQRGLVIKHQQDAQGRDVVTFAPRDTSFAPLAINVTFPANPKGSNVLLDNARLKISKVQAVPMGETGWVGYRTLKELDLPNVNDALFLDQIRSAVEHAVIEPNTAKVDKVIPRQVFDVWHAVMSAVHQEGVRFTLKDMGKPIPFLTFPDKTGREFALDSRVPVQLSIDGDVVLTCHRPVDIKEFAQHLRDSHFKVDQEIEQGVSLTM